MYLLLLWFRVRYVCWMVKFQFILPFHFVLHHNTGENIRAKMLTITKLVREWIYSPFSFNFFSFSPIYSVEKLIKAPNGLVSWSVYCWMLLCSMTWLKKYSFKEENDIKHTSMFYSKYADVLLFFRKHSGSEFIW